MKTIIHKSSSRGSADHGWLKSSHTFSFGSSYDPKKMGFGLLRVINDDFVRPSFGFGTHPHQNMEIISIPLSGSLRHKDSIGNEYVIEAGEVQVMSAGSGILHSEFNNSKTEETNFLQIWVKPKLKDIEPRYSQRNFVADRVENEFQLVVSPDGKDESVLINQDAYFSLIDLTTQRTYKRYKESNGVYIFIINGEVEVNREKLSSRDGVGVEGSDVDLCSSEARVLVMEVPMS